MNKNDYFYDSIPDAISIAINELDRTIECCNQDSYELLVVTFGRKVNGNNLENATQTQLEKFAREMKDYFELSYLPSTNDAQKIIDRALAQWNS